MALTAINFKATPLLQYSAGGLWPVIEHMAVVAAAARRRTDLWYFFRTRAAQLVVGLMVFRHLAQPASTREKMP